MTAIIHPLDIAVRLRHLDVMERITQISLSTDEMADVLRRVLDVVLETFSADRAWLFHPCDPETARWSVPMERTRSEWPGLWTTANDMPMNEELRQLCRDMLETENAVQYGPKAANMVPPSLANAFSIKSGVMIVLQPKVGKPWLFGLHHCCRDVFYSEQDLYLFSAIAGRISDMLSSLLSLKRLRESEEKFRELFENAPVGLAHVLPEGSFLNANPCLAYMLGYASVEELIETVADVATQVFAYPKQRKEIVDAIRASDDWVYAECGFRCKNGAVITVNLRSRKVLNSDGTVAYFEAMLEDITQKKISEELIWKQANFDPLTRLPNRQMLNDRLREEIKKAHCACQCLAVLFIDLDHFKEVNDTLGHQLGDTLLMEAASRIVACVREIDTVARTGGDEFTIILSGLNDSKNADKVSARIAEKILDAVAEPFHLSFETLYISASIGITYYPDDAERIEDLLRHADQAMYVAKKEGRNRYHYFTTALQQSNRARRRLSNDLRIALAKRQFEVYFQPIVELATGKVVKAEALLRWNTPSHRSISPSEFIPVAEDMGLIVEIGEWVFKEVAERTKKWRRMCPKGFQASVNVSPLQFLETTKHCHDWPSYLASNGVDGESIVVEITEGMLLNVEKRSTNPLLFKFRDAGIQVAIDDFGTGYSALSYLKKFHIDYLKIDQSFVRNLNTDLADRVLVEAITAMAHKLGLKVIAEGVETERQKHLLAEAGCDFVQGHLYYPALPSSAFERLLVMQCESTE